MTKYQDLLEYSRQLRQNSLVQNAQYYEGSQYKIALHYPNNGAMKYLFESWSMILNFMGIECNLFPVGDPLDDFLIENQPNIFITVNDPYYLSQIDSKLLERNGVLIGHLSSHFDLIPEDKRHFIIDFFLDKTLPRKILDVPVHQFKFGSNPLIHYPKNITENWKWNYIGTNSMGKVPKATQYIYPVASRYKEGVLGGIGWGSWPEKVRPSVFIQGEVRLDKVPEVYSNSIVSLNFHQDGQIDRYINVNERTFIIPACCGFEIVDKPYCIEDMYSREEMIFCSDKNDYVDEVDYYVAKPWTRILYIEKALKRTYLEHTLFHSMRQFIGFLDVLVEGI